jgi:hypothetical protein
MAIVNWGLLTKSATDSETIEDAIVRLIAAHNDDETAHLDTGQSLQSHKASEIIDHLAASIVADKIAEWIDIKISGSLRRTDFHWSTIFESVDGYDKADETQILCDGYGVGILAYATNDWQNAIYKSLSVASNVTWEKRRRVSFLFRLVNTSGQYVFFGNGPAGGPAGNIFAHIGFKVVDLVLYATVGDGSAEQTINCGSISANVGYRADFDYDGASVEFFLNGASQGSLSVSLPTGANAYARQIFMFYIENTAEATTRQAFVLTWDFWAEL